MTQYELQFLRIDNKGISKKEINQIMHKIASKNFQQNMYAYSIQITVYKFGRTRGIQYTCISLFSICFSLAVSRWNRHDKKKGDALYKLQNTDQLIFCTCFSRVVQVEHLLVSVNLLEDNYGFWNDSHEQNIINLTRQILNSQNCTGLLFLTQGV